MMSFLTCITGFFMNFELLPILEEISIFSNSGHLEWRAGLSDTNLKGTHPGSIPARFGLIMCPNLNCISIMMSFLAYITGFFMNCELLPILTDYAN
jgi:hypothetical protein